MIYLTWQNTKQSESNLKSFAEAVSSPTKVNLIFRFNNAAHHEAKECTYIDNWLELMDHLITEVYASSARLYPMANELRDTYSSMTQKQPCNTIMEKY